MTNGGDQTDLVVAMAKTGQDPAGTSGSQFYIVIGQPLIVIDAGRELVCFAEDTL